MGIGPELGYSSTRNCELSSTPQARNSSPASSTSTIVTDSVAPASAFSMVMVAVVWWSWTPRSSSPSGAAIDLVTVKGTIVVDPLPTPVPSKSPVTVPVVSSKSGTKRGSAETNPAPSTVNDSPTIQTVSSWASENPNVTVAPSGASETFSKK